MVNLTPRARKALAVARTFAINSGQAFVGTEHLLLAIIDSGEGLAWKALRELCSDISDLREKVLVSTSGRSGSSSSDPSASPRLKRAMELAGEEAKRMHHSYIGTEHMLLGLLEEGTNAAAGALESAGIDADLVKFAVTNELTKSVNFPKEEKQELVPAGQSDSTNNQKKPSSLRALKTFGRDITELAREGKVDPVIAREEEISRVIQILCRRSKNNPVLVGEAGVGKTAVAEGLALAIVSGEVPEILEGKKVFSLDLALMVAGTQYRGQFEERLKSVMDELAKNKNIILFLDELHMVVGAGSASGTMDASNIIKPALSRGEFRCIGATTLDEYRKYIEKDAALERRFQMVKVDPPSPQKTVEIIMGLKEKYESFHAVDISKEAVDEAVRLSDRYMPARQLPDKAIDVIDEACSAQKIKASTKSEEMKSLEESLASAHQEKINAIKAHDFEASANWKSVENEISEQIKTVRSRKATSAVRQSLTPEHVRSVVAKWTGIPVSKMTDSEISLLSTLESQFGAKLTGQDAAVSTVSKVLRKGRLDLKDPNRPVGSLLFVGPTGVGKTYLAKLVAETMFGSRDSIIQIDMSEYMEKFSSSRLVGSAPGYVGHEEGGQLTEAVRRTPYSLVLFDEIEKAHPDVLNLLLQVLEEGRLTDSLGRKIDFRNTVIIMTSNVGADSFEKPKSMGFHDVVHPAEDRSAAVRSALKNAFRPEFLNRIDDIAVFQPLDKPSLLKVAGLEIGLLAKRLETKSISLEVAHSALELIADKGYEPAYGARPMRRAVEKLLEDPLAELLIRGEVASPSVLVIEAVDGKIEFSEKTKKKVNPKKEAVA